MKSLVVGYVEEDEEESDDESEAEDAGAERGRAKTLPHSDIHPVVGIRIRPSSVMIPLSIRRSEAEVGGFI